MSERKVLNKYYPPEFDPTKIPRLKRARNRQFTIRIMAPFNMRCSNCGEYIYKGKKFNSRQERVEDEDYLGLMIFRFYIKCPRCVSEISFKTDPQQCDYELEAGATRNFEAMRTAERLAQAELKEKEDEEKNNPMKVLENRTKASQQEMEMLETLEELREMNSRHAKLDHEQVIKLHAAYEQQLSKLQDESDEAFIQSLFGKKCDDGIRRLEDEDEDDQAIEPVAKLARQEKPSDILTQGSEAPEASQQSTKPQPGKKEQAAWQKSVGGLSSKKSLLGIVKKKPPAQTIAKPPDKADSNVSGLGSSTEPATTGTSDDSTSKNPIKTTESNSTGAESVEESTQKDTVKLAAPSLGSGLGLLGAYSDTGSEESD